MVCFHCDSTQERTESASVYRCGPHTSCAAKATPSGNSRRWYVNFDYIPNVYACLVKVRS